MRPEPFSGQEWDGWTRPIDNQAVCKNGLYAIYEDNALEVNHPHGAGLVGVFPSAELARQVANSIESAKAGKRVGPIDELVDALKVALRDQENIAMRASYDGNHEAEDRADARVSLTKIVLAKYGTPEKTGERES